MEDNPYIVLAGALSGDRGRPQSPQILIGQVTSVNPISVVANGLTLDASDLLINKLLMQRAAELDNISGNINGKSVNGNISGELMPFLHVGDNVLLIKESEAKHIVVCSF